MFRFARVGSGLALTAVVGLTPVGARADFDPTKGKVVLDDATYSNTFDGPDSIEEWGPRSYFNRRFNELETIPNDGWVVDVQRSIEGQGALRMDDSLALMQFGLDDIAATLRDRRVEFKAWVLPEVSVPYISVAYTPRESDVATPEDFFSPFGEVRLHPTGRATTDGWREYSSGPVDFALHGAVEARFLLVMDYTIVERSLFGSSSFDDRSFLIDAVSITDLGPRAVPDVACSLVEEQQTCGDRGACFFGRCVDAAAALANPPPEGPVRSRYLDRLGRRMQLVAGGRFTQDASPGFVTTLESLKTESRPTQYWSRLYRAFDDLGDGHISAPSWRRGFDLAAGVCLNQGLADLLPAVSATEPIPMVFGSEPGHPVGAELLEGDVLVAIDGVPAARWADLADRYLRYSGDPRGRAFIVTEQLMDAALRTGATLTFSRCRGTNGAPCTPQQVETITVDLASLTTPVWQGEALEWSGDVPCDFRFRRDVGLFEDFTDGDYVGSVDLDDGALRSIFINGVSGSATWNQNLREAYTNLPNRVLLDERTGNGGTFDGVTLGLLPFFNRQSLPVATIAPQMRPELDGTSADVLNQCLTSGNAFFCGLYDVRPLLDPSDSLLGTASDARLAIVNGRDVSGNDYLPRALQDRTSGQTRVFGPVPTFGAFGPIYRLPRLIDEVLGGSVQVQDTLFWPTFNQRNFEFSTGFGVEPDVIVLQRQSDAVRGVDTILEAAKAWLREGIQ